MMKSILLFIVSVAFLSSSIAYCEEGISSKLEEKYFATLDDWVRRKGPVNEIDNTVGKTCAKLVMLSASAVEKAAFITTRRDEFDFRVDICAKMTVNRVHPQPEFEKKRIVSGICDENPSPLFIKLCKRSGLR